jgi:hypothetical protein
MKYHNGQDVRLGDQVLIANKDKATIVGLIATKEFLNEFHSKDWSYLNTGILLKTDKGELFRYEEVDEGFELISRINNVE